jgi:cell volume regulation protein A
MTYLLILVASVIFLCILADKFSDRLGMPALLLFMFIGILFGSDGIVKIPFDDFHLAEDVCHIALLFIMFYGGFNTKWQLAKPVAAKSIVLSTAGVAITAGITAVLCRLVLHFDLAESFLVGAVLSSTDAASVFSILRKKKLNLKDGTASLLEIESGSNDPMSYMLTVISISLLKTGSVGNIGYLIFAQLIYGIAIGLVSAVLSVQLMQKKLIPEGLETIFMIAAALLCFGLSMAIGGNQYLSVYLMGIIIGNSDIQNKNILIPFFDGVTSLSQIVLFFLLGLLAFPHQIPAVIPISVCITVFLTFIARPIAAFAVLIPFGCSFRQCILVSWAGLRGAASIVFTILAIASGASISCDIYHIVFMAAFFSVAIQGTLLPFVARKLNMVDESADVRKTFNDYQEESAMSLMQMEIPAGHNWENKTIKNVGIPTGSLAIMIKRGHDTIVPRGDTKILANDRVILSVPFYEASTHDRLEEIRIDKGHDWCGKTLEDISLPENELITMIIRGNENLIPDGQTVICEEDIMLLFSRKPDSGCQTV